MFGIRKSPPKVIIYTSPTCPVCKRAKEYFAQKGIAYEEIDVATDRKAATEMVQKTKQMGVPVILINGTTQIGFNPFKLDVALKLKGV
jgi:glutaredoxin 3